MDRDKLNLEIARLQQLVKALTYAAIKNSQSPPVEENFEAALGFTETVLTILRTSTEALSARGIRSRLNDLGYDLTKYANPLGFVHSVLGRLEAQGKIRQSQPGMYVFNNALYQALLALGLPARSGVVPEEPSASDNEALEQVFNVLGFGSSVTAGAVVPGGLTPPPELSDVEKSGKK